VSRSLHGAIRAACGGKRRWARRWRNARGVLFLLGLLGAAALLPPNVAEISNHRAWRLPHNQEQFTRWSRSLAGLGIHVSGRELEKITWQGVQRYKKTWGPVQRQLQPLRSQLGLSQNWAMFSNPQTHPFRVHVDVDRGNGFETIHVSRSDAYTWRREEFDHNRMRKLVGRLGRSGDPGLYEDFTHWVAARVRRDFEDAAKVRVRLYRWTTQLGAPSADSEAGGAFEDARTFELRSGE
jgi:hypothetical protein